jgi:hypothetical protein
MPRLLHVSSVLNRESILAHGLDWTRMGAAPGIAGSRMPEEEGVFLCRDEFEVAWFVRMNNTGGPIDVWAVTGIEEDQLLITANGLSYFPGRMPNSQITLADRAASQPVPVGTQRRKSKQQKKKSRAGK